jgi:dolichol-phosphate mannosyltransferase
MCPSGYFWLDFPPVSQPFGSYSKVGNHPSAILYCGVITLSSLMPHHPSIAVVIPSYRVSKEISSVVSQIGPEVSAIYVVDDCCPEKSGEMVRRTVRDPRVKVLFNEKNLGVGGATIAGYREALRDGMNIVVKIDGDGQMDPKLIPVFVKPILEEHADYTKGNRFYVLEFLHSMPRVRVLGNAMLSLVNKFSSGYWDIMDPTNGYTAIHSNVLRLLPLEKIDKRFFFESDMLFRLSTVRAVVHDIPLEAVYQGEASNLKIGRVLGEFPMKYLSRILKRFFYNYILRDFNICSLEIIFGLFSLSAGVAFGLLHWYRSSTHGDIATTGTVMLAAMPVILGFQLLLTGLMYDVMNVPRRPIFKLFLPRERALKETMSRAANI